MDRLKIVMPENNIGSITLRVRISDVNYANHVGNDAFVAILHEARMQWLQQHNFTEMNAAGASLIMSSLAIEFKNETYYGEEICILIYSGEVSKVGFDLFYQLTTLRNGSVVILANAKTGMVCYNYQLKKVGPIPEDLKRILSAV